MILQIPTSSQNTAYSQVVTLSDVRYTLSLRFNTRMDRWILDIADSAGRGILSGVVMLAIRNLTAQYVTLSLPPGALFCFNSSSIFTDPTLASFLTDTAFLYNDFGAT